MTGLQEARDAVRVALEAAGLPANQVYVAEPTKDAPLPPEGVWVVLPTDGGCTVGGVGRGRFCAYARVDDDAAAADLVLRLLSTRPPSRSAPSGDLEEAGRHTAARIATRTAQRDGRPGPALVTGDDLLDLVGPETGHHLYALGTPMPERSQPPTEGGEYHRYQVGAALPDAQEGVAAPWFEQPGGGAMVVLSRPVRWYADEGYLVER